MNMKPLTDAEVDETDDRRSVPERRESPRKKVLKGGRAVWPNGDSTNVIVCSLSDTGARLEIRDPVPNTFDIVIDGDQYPRSCRVVWRRADRIGVEFQGSSQFARSSVGSTSRISACSEYAEMCRTLAKRVAPSDREMLLKMADAWEKIARRLRTAGTRRSDI